MMVSLTLRLVAVKNVVFIRFFVWIKVAMIEKCAPDTNILFECIPDLWFVNEEKTLCYWPPKSKKSSTLRAMSQDEPEDDWNVYECELVCEEQATYSIGSNVAREKSSQNYNTSSADEHIQLAKFRREHPGLIHKGEKCFEKIFAAAKAVNVLEKSQSKVSDEKAQETSNACDKENDSREQGHRSDTSKHKARRAIPHEKYSNPLKNRSEDNSQSLRKHSQSRSNHSQSRSNRSQSRSSCSQSRRNRLQSQWNRSQSKSNRSQPRSNHSQSRSNHSQSRSNHSQSRSNHSQSRSNHSQSRSNHSQSRSNHSQSRSNHSQSRSNHSQSRRNHSQSRSNHSQSRGNNSNSYSSQSRSRSKSRNRLQSRNSSRSRSRLRSRIRSQSRSHSRSRSDSIVSRSQSQNCRALSLSSHEHSSRNLSVSRQIAEYN